MTSHPVKLYVYDLSHGMVKQFSMMLCGKQFEGLWHTGLVVYGYEYYYGGGINRDPPGISQAGAPWKVIDLGNTQIDQTTFEQYLNELSPKYTMATYDLLRNNCNNFCDDAAKFLTGKPIPEFVTSLPNEFLATPLGQSLYPMIDRMMGRMNPVQDGNSNQVQFGNPATQPFGPSSGQTLGSSLNLIPPQLSTKPQTPEEAVSQLRPVLITSVDPNRILSKLYEYGGKHAATLPNGENTMVPNPTTQEPMPHPSLITETDKTLLNSKETLQFLTNPQSAPIPKNLIALITRLKLLWNKSLHGPVIDFIRLFALNERGQGSILRIPGEKDAKGMTPPTPLSARTIVSDYLTLTGTDQSDPTVQGNAVLAMRVIGNLCATTNGRSFLLDSSDKCQPTNFIFFLSKVVEMLNHESGMITKHAILLLYNLIVSMTVDTREHEYLLETVLPALENTLFLWAGRDESAFDSKDQIRAVDVSHLLNTLTLLCASELGQVVLLSVEHPASDGSEGTIGFVDVLNKCKSKWSDSVVTDALSLLQSFIPS